MNAVAALPHVAMLRIPGVLQRIGLAYGLVTFRPWARDLGPLTSGLLGVVGLPVLAGLIGAREEPAGAAQGQTQVVPVASPISQR